jgi:hypothetical protein
MNDAYSTPDRGEVGSGVLRWRASVMPLLPRRLGRHAVIGGVLALALGSLASGAIAQAGQTPLRGGMNGIAVPSASASGYAAAFQANTGDLWVVRNGAGRNLRLGMRPGTSPAVAGPADGGLVAAFQANTGKLWVVHNGAAHSLRLGMRPGTSPAITALPGGGYEAAFQANTGDLWVVRNGAGQDLRLGMRAGTSPATGGVS